MNCETLRSPPRGREGGERPVPGFSLKSNVRTLTDTTLVWPLRTRELGMGVSKLNLKNSLQQMRFFPPGFLGLAIRRIFQPVAGCQSPVSKNATTMPIRKTGYGIFHGASKVPRFPGFRWNCFVSQNGALGKVIRASDWLDGSVVSTDPSILASITPAETEKNRGSCWNISDPAPRHIDDAPLRAARQSQRTSKSFLSSDVSNTCPYLASRSVYPWR